MKIVKPAWVNHGGKSIFSIDIHPDGTRFATGGQGEDSGKIVIWSMLPVQDAEKENNKNVPKLLCQMDNHLACVNSVRWSHNGRHLASGGDDKLVMIWRYAGGTSRSFGSEQENVENWRCTMILRGHSGDVLDVAWAPRDVYLATCSVDNVVIVWNALSFPEQVRVLKGHSGLVKGVAWDPVGKYLASQSDDRSLIVWRTRDWRAEATVSKPFAECGGTTHVLRPAWSPEGSLLVSAHAMNNAGPVAKIIERTSGWKADMDFVGHRKAVTCVRFNPRVFQKKAARTSEKPIHYCCCAVGSRDTSFSVWLTSLKRPLVVMHDMFENSILDLAWNAVGTELLVCSTDGTVGYVQFAGEELGGRSLSEDEKSKLLLKFYGESVVSNGLPATANTQIIESTAMLKLQQQTAAAAAAAVQDTAAATVVGSVTTTAGPTASNDSSMMRLTKQLETRTADGKRRITPIFLSPPPDLGDVPLPTALPTFTTSTEQSKIVVEKADETATVDGGRESDEEQDRYAPSSPAGPAIVSIEPMTPHEAKDLSGKRATATSTPRVSEKGKDKAKELPETLPSARVYSKRKLDDVREKQKKKKRDAMLPGSTPANPEPLGDPEAQPAARVADDRTVAPGAGSLPAFLPAPQPTKFLSAKAAFGAAVFNLEVENDIQWSSGAAMLHRLRCLRGPGEASWERVFGSKVTLLAVSRWAVIASLEDNTVVLLTTDGRLVCPPIAIDAAAAFVRATSHLCLVVTCKGTVLVWNTKLMECVVDAVNLAAICTHKISAGGTATMVDNVQLTDACLVVVTVRGGDSYCYDCKMKAWLRLVAEKDAVHQCCDQKSAPLDGSGVPAASRGLLSSLSAIPARRSGESAATVAGRVYQSSSDAGLQRSCTLSCLEGQLAAALALGSPHEYKFWLLSFVRYLAQQGLEGRLRLLCDDLLGSPYKTAASQKNDGGNILGLNKYELLLEALPIIGSNLQLQRLFEEYQELVDTTSTTIPVASVAPQVDQGTVDLTTALPPLPR